MNISGVVDRAGGPDGVMVFDGACNLCAFTVRLVIQMDSCGVIRFTAAQSAYGRALCNLHGVRPDDPSTFLFFDHGHPRQASGAVIALVGRMPRPWRWLRVIALVPAPVRDAAYRWTAQNRYRLFGRRAICMLSTPELKARFIDGAPARGVKRASIRPLTG